VPVAADRRVGQDQRAIRALLVHRSGIVDSAAAGDGDIVAHRGIFQRQHTSVENSAASGERGPEGCGCIVGDHRICHRDRRAEIDQEAATVGLAAVAVPQHQPVQSDVCCSKRNVDDPCGIAAIDRDVRIAVAVNIAGNPDPTADDQLSEGQIDGLVVGDVVIDREDRCIEADRVTVLRQDQGFAQTEPGAGGGAVILVGCSGDDYVDKPRAEGGLCGFTDCHGRPNGAGAEFKIPVAAKAFMSGHVAGRGDIGICQVGEQVDEVHARAIPADIATVEQDVAAISKRHVPVNELAGIAFDVRNVEGRRSERQRTGRSV